MRNSRRGEVDPFIVMDVMARASALEAQGRKVIHMEVGQPGTGAPEGARRAAAEAMEAGPLGYTLGLGLPELRARIARHYGEVHDLELDPGRVIVTAGASGAFLLAFTALFDAGDRVGLGTPCYPSYRQIMRALSLTPVALETTAESRFQPVPEQLGADLAGLMIASPTNPTGTMLDREALAGLVRRCADLGIALISDEIYHGLSYGTRAVSALELSDDLYVVNSFSKYFSMTGWRLGWMVVPEDHVRRIERLAQNMFICAPHVSQVAALAAMDCRDELDGHIATYAENRALLSAALEAAGLPFAPPDGAFYIYADVSGITGDAGAFCAALLEEAGVAATPGYDFDAARGGRFVRFSYARSPEDIREGAARVVDFVQAWRASGRS